MNGEYTLKPYCFVITSFGEKVNLNDTKFKQAAGISEPVKKINFDLIYAELVKPAIILAGLEPLIEREEKNGGNIHKTMYEKIILCEFCIADLTNLNVNVYYELGMRYAVKPFTTIPIIASSHSQLVFDVAPNRTYIYQVDSDFFLSDKQADIKKLANRLEEAKTKRTTDSPLYDLINGITFQNSVAHEKTDIFREKVQYDNAIKEELAYARNMMTNDMDKTNAKTLRIQAIRQIVEKYKPLENIEIAVLIDIMISYRNVNALYEMQSFIEQLPRYVLETIMVQEQYAFVLNRNGNNAKPVDTVMIDKAERVLQKLEESGKASSETYGIWGRIYKDKFDNYYQSENPSLARIYLKKALFYYQKGFEFDPRDAYPGVNYITCLELLDERKKALRLIPAVEYAVIAKMKRKQPDYWDYATLLELAVIEGRFEDARKYFDETIILAVESWMFETTKENLSKILNFRIQRNEDTNELKKIINLYN